MGHYNGYALGYSVRCVFSYDKTSSKSLDSAEKKRLHIFHLRNAMRSERNTTYLGLGQYLRYRFIRA